MKARIESLNNAKFGDVTQVMYLISFYYLILLIIAFLAAVTFPLKYLIVGALIFLLYSIFFISGYFYAPYSTESNSKTSIESRLSLIFVTIQIIVLFFCLNFVIKFYTGSNIILALNNLTSGISNYLAYQEYFAESGLSQMTLDKVFPIMANVYIKICFLHSLYLFFLPSSSDKKIKLFYLLMTLFVLMLYSIARGTNIELFEIFFSFAYCVFNRKDLLFLIRKNIKYLLLILCALVGAFIVFINSVNARAIITCYTVELCIDDTALLSQLNESLAYLSFVLSGYFTFGFYYIGHIVIDVIYPNLVNFLVFPTLSGFKSFGDSMCGITFDCGVNWEPDFSKLISTLGLMPAIIFLFLFGFFLKKTQIRFIYENKFLDFCLSYFLFLYLISLPIGQFISSSSQNFLILSFVFFYTLFKQLYFIIYK